MKDKIGNSVELIMKDGEIFSVSVRKQTGSSLNLNEETAAPNGGIVDQDVKVPFGVIEEAPIFPGCENAEDKKRCFQDMMQTHIRKNFRYPQEAQVQGIQGRVNVIFTISKEGEITNFRMRGPHKLLEDEAKRIIDKLPRMQPGKQKGMTVEVPFSIPISFKLQ
ncbi:energy transducer TonB [Flagellimonas onchidii]|uniref:energy transducer TonB n=1 Tax=Flagellimonas onchidii TaxID=2562684 RepID=UPI0010A5E2CB|nr:energy transducer TonB [Allomuricauda onchidii]